MPVREDLDSINSVVVLRAEIRRLQAALERAQQESHAERDVDSVTEILALQQEIDSLRRKLKEKDRIIETTADQCRRLEDELEDQRLAYDSLKQDLERTKQSLAAAREQASRLSRERSDIESRYQNLLDEHSSMFIPESAIEDEPTSQETQKKRFSQSFMIGLIAGLSFVVVLLGGLLLGWIFFKQPADNQIAPTRPPSDPNAPPMESPAPTAGLSQIPEQNPGTQEKPKTLPMRRDRLRDGTPGPLMALVPSATFTMGKNVSIASDDRGPAHQVHLASYRIGATEVTFEEYDRYARATGARMPNDFGWGRGRRPVVDVSWEEAVAYTRWLSQETGKVYRLPSEAEWEYAASAGRRSTYWWGYELEKGRAVCLDCGSPWDRKSTAPVASFPPNPFGLYDTAGNAMEWVEDCYHPNYRGAPQDGLPWVSGDCTLRVARGGAFNKPARSIASTHRNAIDAKARFNMLGFRIARDE